MQQMTILLTGGNQLTRLGLKAALSSGLDVVFHPDITNPLDLSNISYPVDIIIVIKESFIREDNFPKMLRELVLQNQNQNLQLQNSGGGPEGIAEGVVVLTENTPQNFDTKVIALLSHEDVGGALLSLRTGVRACLPRDVSSKKLCWGVRQVYEHGRLVGDDFFREKISEISEKMRRLMCSPVTDKEIMILFMYRNGGTTKEIGQTLGLSPRTIEATRDRLRVKTGTKTIQDLMIYFVKFLENASPDVPSQN